MQRSAAPPVPAAEPESSNRPGSTMKADASTFSSSDLSVFLSDLISCAVVESASLKTPATKVARVNKNVVVQRQPIPGAQVSQSDKVGIGISFGMTQKGDVFITGMAPNGPAKACGNSILFLASRNALWGTIAFASQEPCSLRLHMQTN